jgi:hypothetical protein
VTEIFTPARRVALMDDLVQAGDYSGPHQIEIKGRPCRVIYFLLPVHEGSGLFDRPTQGSGLHAVYEPPWTFTDYPDGSVGVQASIGCGQQPYYWHGYLDPHNTWRQV